MITTAIRAAVSKADDASARVESRWRNGCAHVVSIQCRTCGVWVDPGDWDPKAAACDECVRRETRYVPVSERSGRARLARAGGPR